MQIKLCFLIFLLSFTAPAMTADWSDNEISILKGNKYHDNGNSHDISKTIVTLQHSSSYKYGRNFYFMDVLKSDDSDHRYGEVYGEYYHTLSYAKIAQKDWSNNFLKDVGLSGGINYGAKNSAFGSNPEIYLAGAAFDFKIPGFSFFNISTYAYMDASTHSGFGGGYTCGKNSTTYQITPAWHAPFSFGKARFSFQGFVDFTGKHGTCADQILAQPQLRYDIGNQFGKADTFYIGFEYQYWKNKYGTKGKDDNFPQALFTWKL